LDNAVILTVSIPRLKYHEIFFRILADYHLSHLVKNVAIHTITLECIVFENFTTSTVDLMV